ncbi:MAG: cyclopropane-fatty-acyl-phospholipid synthase family protein [Gammaproteobacteria bacterium]|nr:cyclopropane-fatty-acyl-phospholipid synthase family protein [Gammaproteobacteria bacterium]
MKTLSVGDAKFLQRTQKPTWLDRLARKIVLARLRSLRYGSVSITEHGETSCYGVASEDFPMSAHIRVNSPAFYSDIAFGGSVGSGEAFIHGHWECDEVESLVQILLRNREVLDNLDSGASLVTAPLQKAFHWFNRNTRKGSRKNISAHYDLGNDFYKLWLDKNMMYSSAFFESAEVTLDEAAEAKLDRICRKLHLTPDDKIVEIGTGWGGFAVYAAKHYGCHVTTTTISQQQHEYASARVEQEGLQDRIELLTCDYRDLEGQFDKLVSIEMIEAVGHEYLDTFFDKCSSLLRPDGEMLLQAITIADQRYDKAKKTVDFIKRYVFPGGFLPSVTAMNDAMTRVTDLRSIHIEDIGAHYALTLQRWRERFFDRMSEVRQQGFSDEFLRMWEFYLCYCEGAFLQRAIGVVQLHTIKPFAQPRMVASVQSPT